MVLLASGLSYWTDSEMWIVAASQYLFKDLPEYYFGTKPLFHFSLFLNHSLASQVGLFPMDLARLWMSLSTVSVAVALYLLIQRECGRRIAVVALALLLSLSFFVKRAGHVRSDLIAANIVLWYLYFLPLLKPRLQPFVFAAMAVISLLVTPKAVFFIVAFWPFYRRKLQHAWAPALAVVPALISAVYLVPELNRLVSEPFTFFVRSFYTSEVGLPYFSLERFQHVTRFARENLHVSVPYLGILLLWPFSKFKNEYQRNTFLLGSTLFAILVVYPDRLPFFIASLLPFFILQISFSPWFQAIFASSQGRNATMITVAVSFLLSLHWSLTIFGGHLNHQQRRTAAWLDREVALLPPIEIFDPGGILAKRPVHFWFLGPGQTDKNRYVMVYIDDRKPEVMLYSAKLGSLQPALGDYMKENYWGDSAGVFIRKVWIENPGLELDTAELAKRMHSQFPRLANLSDITWLLRIQLESGLELKREFKKDFFTHRRLRLPPDVSSITVTPFELSLPFGTHLAKQFAYDAEF